MKFPFTTLNMTGEWECRTYELDIKDPDEEAAKRKGFFGKLKDKVFKSKKQKDADEAEEKKKPKTKPPVTVPGFLKPLFKHLSTPAPHVEVVEGKIWVTNRLRIRGNFIILCSLELLFIKVSIAQ